VINHLRHAVISGDRLDLALGLCLKSRELATTRKHKDNVKDGRTRPSASMVGSALDDLRSVPSSSLRWATKKRSTSVWLTKPQTLPFSSCSGRRCTLNTQPRLVLVHRQRAKGKFGTRSRRSSSELAATYPATGGGRDSSC
jgi:hypothetical protein